MKNFSFIRQLGWLAAFILAPLAGGLVLAPFSATATYSIPKPVISATGPYTWGTGAKPARLKPGVNSAPKISKPGLNAVTGPVDSLPSKVDYSALVPPVGNQGAQGSCVGWAVGYYYKTIQEYRERHWSLTSPSHQFSPSFIYNQINGGYDQGAWPSDAFELLKSTGDVSIENFPYSQTDYYSQPGPALKSSAAPYKAKSWVYLFYNPAFLTPNPPETVGLLKQYLAQGDVFNLTFPVYREWDYVDHSPNAVVTTPANKYSYRGDHEITVIGYDDNISSSDGNGAFRVVNQWGTGWGNQGYTWLSYAFVSAFAEDASAMTDLIDPANQNYSVVKDQAGSGITSSTFGTQNFTGSGWTHIADSSSLSGTLATSFSPGDSFTLPFYGSSITWIGPLTQQSGTADVYIDGIFQQRVDQWQEGKPKARNVLYHRADLPFNNHTLKLVVEGTTLEHCPGNWSCTPLPAKPATQIDAVLINAEVQDDISPQLSYSGNWNMVQGNNKFYNSTLTASSEVGSSVSFNFSATTVAWAGSTGPDQGRADIYLDGILVSSVELYSATPQYNQILFSKGGLNPGSHILLIKVRPDISSLSSNKFVNIDYFMAETL